MPAVSFSTKLDWLLDGNKDQTIRLPRKVPFQLGDVLYVYWKQRAKGLSRFLFQSRVFFHSFVPYNDIRLCKVERGFAWRDGFTSIGALCQKLEEMHGKETLLKQPLEVIRFFNPYKKEGMDYFDYPKNWRENIELKRGRGLK